MSKIFTKNYRTRYSEINANGLLDPADCARYIIDTAYDWGERLGLGHTASNELDLYWVVRENEIHLFEPLHFMEEFDFTIWMFEWKRVRGTRAFEMKRKSDGALIAHGVQKLVCLDIKTQRLVTPPEELLKNFRLDNPREIPSQRFPKIPPPPETALTFQQKATWQDVDMLEMVNNAVYISYAEEAVMQMLAANGWSLPKLKAQGLEIAFKRVHIQYKKPAVWNDTINMPTFLLKLNDSGGSFFVSMTRVSDAETIANCILDWSSIDVNRMKACSLPDSLKKRLENG
jgi:YbgC/YbaW family acyl-CoA thioester hydrolase